MSRTTKANLRSPSPKLRTDRVPYRKVTPEHRRSAAVRAAAACLALPDAAAELGVLLDMLDLRSARKPTP